MKLKTYIIVCSVVFVLQAFITSLLPVFRGVDPLLCLMLAVVFIYQEEDLLKPIVVTAFFTLAKDLFFNQYIGVSLISLVVMVSFVLLIRRSINTESLVTDAGISALAILIHSSCYWLMYKLLGSPYTYFYMLKKLPLVLAIEVVITEAILYFFINKVVQARRDGYFK